MILNEPECLLTGHSELFSYESDGLGDLGKTDAFFVFHIGSMARIGQKVKGFEPTVTKLYNRPWRVVHLYYSDLDDTNPRTFRRREVYRSVGGVLDLARQFRTS